MALTRRRLLLGAGAVAVVGGGGAVLAVAGEAGVRRRLHGAGLLSGPDLRAPDAVNVAATDTTIAAPGGRPVDVTMSTFTDPPGVIVALHGRGEDRHAAFAGMALHQFARPFGFAVVALDGGSAYWHRRADGRDPERTIVDDLLPALADRLPTARPVLLGWSMGGFGALHLALRHPGVFVAAAASAPAVFRSFATATPGAFDDATDFGTDDLLAAAAKGGFTHGPVRVDTGADDPFVGTSRSLLGTPGVAGHIGPGFHDTATWRSFLPAQLAFLRAAVLG